MAETPLRKNELRVIALLSGMIRQYNEIDSNIPLDDMYKLICKTAIEILNVCESEQLSCDTCIDLNNLTGTQKCSECSKYDKHRAT